MMAFPSQPSNQKWGACLAKTARNPRKMSTMSILRLLILIAAILGCDSISVGEPPPDGEDHELEELGVNRFTAPSIAQIFKQLDDLKPLPYDQLKRELPQTAGASREQKALMFG